MSHSTDGISIHTKKYFRVILEGIDSNLETVESFAVKLSTRARVSLPRAMLVASRLPYIVKSGLEQGQANRLRGLLEEIGGKARVEAHFVTPDDPAERPRDVLRDLRQDALRETAKPLEEHETIVCPECGWEERGGASFCSFCHRRFRDPDTRPVSLEERLPDVNPLDVSPADNPLDWAAIMGFYRGHQLHVLIGLVVVLILVILSK
jgi:hypothetical protein